MRILAGVVIYTHKLFLGRFCGSSSAADSARARDGQTRCESTSNGITAAQRSCHWREGTAPWITYCPERRPLGVKPPTSGAGLDAKTKSASTQASSTRMFQAKGKACFVADEPRKVDAPFIPGIIRQPASATKTTTLTSGHAR